MAHRIMTAWPP